MIEPPLGEAGPHTARLEECDRLARDWAVSVGQEVGSSAYWSVYWMQYFSAERRVSERAPSAPHVDRVRNYWSGERLETFKQAYASGGLAAALAAFPGMSKWSAWKLASFHKVKAPRQPHAQPAPATPKPTRERSPSPPKPKPPPREKKWQGERLRVVLDAFAIGGARAAMDASPGLSEAMAYYLAKEHGVKRQREAAPPRVTKPAASATKRPDIAAKPPETATGRPVSATNPPEAATPKVAAKPFQPYSFRPLSAMGQAAIDAWNADLDEELRATRIGASRR